LNIGSFQTAGAGGRRTTIHTIPVSLKILREALITASGLQGRHLRRFNPEKCRYLVADNIEDFSPLTALSAFQRLQQDIRDFSRSVQRR
jgi:hypothetical protein